MPVGMFSEALPMNRNYFGFHISYPVPLLVVLMVTLACDLTVLLNAPSRLCDAAREYDLLTR